MDYISRNHSKYLLMCHLIFVCKYRKKLLVIFEKEIKQIFLDIAKENGFGIIKMEADKDHIHLLIEYNPNQSILEIVRLLKQISTYRIWRENGNDNYLSREFWKEKTFWSDGYFACSIGNVSREAIEKYIQEQG
jgi:putative transposase